MITNFKSIIYKISILVVFGLICCTVQEENDKNDFISNEKSKSGIKIVDSDGNVGQYTSIAVDGSNVYISYYDGTNGDLKFAKSTDGGENWPDDNIKTVDTLLIVGQYSSIAVDGSNIYILYFDLLNFDLKIAKSTDSGATWPSSNIKKIDTTEKVGLYSSIAVDGMNVYTAYSDVTNWCYKFAKSTDGGVTWPSSNIKILNDGINTSSAIAINGSNIYTAYGTSSTSDLKVAKSEDSGSTWPATINKYIDSNDLVGQYASIAVHGTTIYVSYYDRTNGNLKIAKSTNSSGSWPSNNMITVDSFGDVGEYSSIGYNSTTVYISYYDKTNEDLKLASLDPGMTWTINSIKSIDSSGSVGSYSSIAVDDGNIYISYYDKTNGDLKFAKSSDYGQTW